MKIQSIALVLMFFMAFVSSNYPVHYKVFGANDSFSANGEISSLVFGMPPSTNTVNMSLRREIHLIWLLELSY